jgi:hypothetical protein
MVFAVGGLAPQIFVRRTRQSWRWLTREQTPSSLLERPLGAHKVALRVPGGMAPLNVAERRPRSCRWCTLMSLTVAPRQSSVLSGAVALSRRSDTCTRLAAHQKEQGTISRRTLVSHLRVLSGSSSTSVRERLQKFPPAESKAEVVMHV